MQLELPASFAQRLAKDGPMEVAVKSTTQRFSTVLDQGTMPFFPDFTDHGVYHLTQVLSLAEWLINTRGDLPDEVTPNDVGVFILSVLLHDLAMYTTPDGFLYLVKPDNPDKGRYKVDHFDNEPWERLWVLFWEEATHWDDRQIGSRLGPEAVDSERAFLDRRPDSVSPEYWTNVDRRLIGEFLRRHHPRLAHEIALYGIPGPEPEGLKVTAPDGFPEAADLAGLVARSHGLPLRQTFDYLRQNYDNLREFRSTHPVFLMVLLRIADILHLHAERAPNAIGLIRRLRDPMAIDEWRAHQAVRDVRYDVDADPEMLTLHMKPDNIETFLKLRQWQRSIQEELDLSWAVLGEVYARFERLQKLTLSIRRVKSNLDEEGFGANSRFLPEAFSFGVARAEVLALLVGPLYGNRPEVGIRELVQNSVDAVREMQEIASRPDSSAAFDLREQEADIVVHLFQDPGGQHWLQVSDRGVGMTAGTIRDYFLRAGASFRDSPEWRRAFGSPAGSSLRGGTALLRTGRFGIGVFATYLLGEEIQVESRHYSQPMDAGLYFHATLDTNPIQIDRKSLQIGTRIRVAIDRSAAEYLTLRKSDWHWYHLGYPEVVLKVGDAEQQSSRTSALPTPQGPRTSDWHRVDLPDDAVMLWSCRHPNEGVFVNGFLLDKWASRVMPGGGMPYRFSSPSVALYDPRATMPINLQRNGFSQEPAFVSLLAEAVLRSYFAYLFVVGPATAPTNVNELLSVFQIDHRGPFHQKSFEDVTESSLLLLENGFTLPSEGALRRNRVEYLTVMGEDLLFLRSDEDAGPPSPIDFQSGQAWYRVKKIYAEEQDPIGWIQEVYEDQLRWANNCVTGVRFYGRGPLESSAVRFPPSEFSWLFQTSPRLERRENGWYSIVVGEPRPPIMTANLLEYVDRVVALKISRGFSISVIPPFLAEFSIDPAADGSVRDLLEEEQLWMSWMEVLQVPYLAYSRELRERQIESTLVDLEEYIVEHREHRSGRRH